MVDIRYTNSLLVCRVQGRTCALPIEHVGEIMRPLHIDRIPGAPHYILGLAVIRGVATPVLNMASLFEQIEARVERYERFISIKVAGRPLALAVGQVQGVSVFARQDLSAMPSLMQSIGSDLIESIGVRDAALFLVLDGARLLPEGALAAWEGSA